MEVSDSKKAGDIIGGVKDNGASLNCWLDYTSSFQFFEACTHGGEQGSPVGNGLGFMGPSGSNEVP